MHLPAAAAVGVALELVGAVVERDLLVVGLLVREGSNKISRMRVCVFPSHRQTHTKTYRVGDCRVEVQVVDDVLRLAPPALLIRALLVHHGG